jgi:hypothetical protein
VFAAALAGCGGGAAATAPDRPQRVAARELVFMTRNYKDAVPEEVRVFSDGRVEYRYLLHTLLQIKVRRTNLSPAAMERFRGLLARTDLDGAQRLGAQPPPGYYWYLLRLGDRTVTTADGHLTAGVRPLIRWLGRLDDRMLVRGG